METPLYGSVGWKPLVWVCHVLSYFTIETRETSQRFPICRGVHMYGSTHVHTWVHLHACVWVGLGKLYGLRGSTEVKKWYRIDIVKWICATDWVCVRTWENNLLMTSSVQLVNDTYWLRASGPCEFGIIKNFEWHNIQTSNEIKQKSFLNIMYI